MDSPGLDNRFSSTSQKYVGSSNAMAHQSIQRHNFLVPKEQQPQLNLPYRGGNDKKSPLKPQSRKVDSSLNQKDLRGGFST